MAMIKCKECGAEISSKADACPKCGAKRKKRSGLGCLFLIILLFIVFGAIVSSVDTTTKPSPAQTSPTSQRSPSTATPERALPTPEQPKLLLLNWTWHEEYGYAIVEGEVKNISQETLKNVEAVAKFYTADKKFITSDDSLIAYNPILPGQTSPFKVSTTHNPAMNSASITFKEPMGGAILFKKNE